MMISNDEVMQEYTALWDLLLDQLYWASYSSVEKNYHLEEYEHVGI